MDDRFLQDSLEDKMSHVVEEIGELNVETGNLLAAIGKTQRWGPQSYNPLIPVEDRETNAAWIVRAFSGVYREVDDLLKTMGRLRSQMRKEGLVPENAFPKEKTGITIRIEATVNIGGETQVLNQLHVIDGLFLLGLDRRGVEKLVKRATVAAEREIMLNLRRTETE